MIKIVIVDDQSQDSAYLEKCFIKFFKEMDKPYQITKYENALSLLEQYHHDFDLIVLDIDMPGLNGMDAAKRIREFDDMINLMFVTNMPQYALDGFSVNAINYIIKPISYPDFRLKMQNAMRYLKQDKDPRLTIATSEGNICLQSSDIYYIESQLHYLIYHTSKGDLKTRDTLNSAETIFSPYHFARSGASYLVNLRYVESLHGDDLLVNGVTLRISRSKKNAFLSAFTKYMGGLN